ncbi:MAG: hypothetical protein AAF355_12465 [Myxococcota bacterium]
MKLSARSRNRPRKTNGFTHCGAIGWPSLASGPQRWHWRRPSSAIRTLPDSLEVHVVEPDPPEGEAPVQWTLCTSEPIDTEAQVLRVVDMYRARRCTEVFFKALGSI